MINLSQASKSVTITGVCVANQDLFSLVSSAPENKREQIVLDILAIGSTAMARVQSALDVDFVEKRFAALAGKFEVGLAAFQRQTGESIEKRFSPTQSGSYTKYVADLVSAVRKDVQGWTSDLEKRAKDLLDPEKKGSAVGRFEEILDEAVDRFEGMFDPDVKDSYASQLDARLSTFFGGDGRPGVLGNALTKAMEPVLSEIHDLKERFEAKKAAEQVIAVTPIKGFDFESDIERRLCALARPHGDAVRSVGTGPGGAKSGDFVVDISEYQKRIAVEARARKVTGPTIREDLKKAVAARGADFGILVVRSTDLLPEYVGGFQIYDHQVVTDCEHLEAAFRVARVILAMSSVEADSVDFAAIRSKLVQLRDAVSRERNIRTEATKVDSAIENIRSQAGQISTAVLDLTAQIEALLRRPESRPNAA